MLHLPEEPFGNTESRLYLSEEEKAELYKVAQDHIQRAQTEREYYKSRVAAAEASWSASEDGKCIPTLGHYSYDFVQQIHLPFNAQQSGPEYFKTSSKMCNFRCV